MASAQARRSSLVLLTLLGGLAAPPALAADPPLPLPPLERGRIGVQVQSLTPELREHFAAPTDRGLLVARVLPDRPASRAGVRVGDVLLDANGEPLRVTADLLRIVAGVEEGERLSVRLVRAGKERTLELEPEGEAHAGIPADAWEGWNRWFHRGMRQGSRELRQRLEELEDRLEDLERRLEAGDANSKPT